MFAGVFPDGGPRPFVFTWSALFLALGWTFLDYGFDSPGGGTGHQREPVHATGRHRDVGSRIAIGLHPIGRGRRGTRGRRREAGTRRPPPGGDVVERLATLADLRERGLLDADEYERAQDAVLRRAES
jgi:hypothetical protein